MATVEITYKKHVDSPNETFRDVKLQLAPGWIVMKRYAGPTDLFPVKEWGINSAEVLAYEVTE